MGKVLYSRIILNYLNCLLVSQLMFHCLFWGIAVNQYRSRNDCLNGCGSLATSPGMTKKHGRQRLSVPLSGHECFMTWTSDNAAHSQCHFRLLFSLGTTKTILLDEAKPKKTCKSPSFQIMVHGASYHMSHA